MVMIDMVFKKTVNADAGSEAEDKLDSKGNFIARREDDVKQTAVSNVDSTKKPKVLAIVDDSKKSKVMLAELKERKVDVVTEAKADLQSKDIVKEIKDVIKSEKSKNNEYDVIYLPVTNTDFNKRSADYTQIRAQSEITVNLYFQDREDVDVANKAFVRKIE